MKDVSILFLFLILAPALSSCINMNDPVSQARYIESRNSFDSTLVKYLPDRLPNHTKGYSFNSLLSFKFTGFSKISLTTVMFSKNRYQKEKGKLIEKARNICKSTDECVLVIETDKGLNNKQFNFENCRKPIPVPDFAVCESNNTRDTCKIVQDIDLIIFDYDYIDRIDKSQRLRGKRRHLPDEFSKGYSTGVTANNKDLTIQYWLIIW